MVKKRDSEGIALRVASYNIRHAEGMDGRIDLVRIADVISRLEPDLIALQEVDKGVARTGGVDQMVKLAELTRMHAAFGKFMAYEGGEYGMGILSRWSIKEAINYVLPPGTEPRSALAARVGVRNSGEIVFVGIHLFDTAEERLAQSKALAQLFEAESAPVILAGDFNTEPEEDVLHFLKQNWTVPGKGDDRLSWPSDEPQVEIDYVMYRPGDRFKVLECRLVDEALASDHRPLVVTLKMV